MTKIVKNFNGFSKVYENDMSVDKSAEIIDKAKKEFQEAKAFFFSTFN